MSLHLRALYPSHLSGGGLSHIPLSVCGAMNTGDLRVTLTVPAAAPRARQPFVEVAISRPLQWASYRFFKDSKPRVQRKFVRRLGSGDLAYLWPGVALEVYRQLRRRGVTIFNERINTHQATGRAILEAEYDRLGWPAEHGITDDHIAHERENLALSDYIFAPSPLVAQSLLDHGVPAAKVLTTSYGWDEARFHGDSKALEPIAGFTALFVGQVGVRKGAPLLLDYWAAAGVTGRLVLTGRMDANIAQRCADALNRADVVRPGHVQDIGGVYRSADAFVFPSLEEGSPLVVYEAMACGLPVLVSPMGGGGVVRDGVEGLVRDPHDREAWIAALQLLAKDADLRRTLGENARQRAAELTWRCVGARRAEMVLARLAQPALV